MGGPDPSVGSLPQRIQAFLEFRDSLQLMTLGFQADHNLPFLSAQRRTLDLLSQSP